MSRARKKLTTQPNRGRNTTVIEPPNYNKMPPIFSLEKVVSSKYCFSKLKSEDKQQFAESIFKRQAICWEDILKTDRHGLGTEKIPKVQIKGSMPKFITDEFDYFLAFRFSGMKSMVGYRDKNIFYVLWFDHDFTLYPH